MSGLARLVLLKAGVFADLTGTTIDNQLLELIEAASQVARMYTGREFTLETNTGERYTGDDTNRLYLNEWPVTEIAKVQFWDGDEWDTETATNYTLIRNRFILYPSLEYDDALYSTWIDTYDEGIKIDYTSGYDNSGWNSNDGLNEPFGVPADLEHAVCQIAYKMYKDGTAGGGRFGLTQMSKGAESMAVDKFIKGLSDEILVVLKSYMKLSL